jgi:hypothetical protein
MPAETRSAAPLSINFPASVDSGLAATGDQRLAMQSSPARSRSRVADSTDGAAAGTFTLDSEVSRRLAKPFTQKDNPGADGVTVLHGNSKSG